MQRIPANGARGSVFEIFELNESLEDGVLKASSASSQILRYSVNPWQDFLRVAFTEFDESPAISKRGGRDKQFIAQPSHTLAGHSVVLFRYQ